MGPALPRHEEDRLRAAVTGRSRAELALEPSLTEVEEERLRELVRRRRGGEPLQYLEGTVRFGPLELAIDRRALIPRPETELLWEMAVEALGGISPSPQDGARPKVERGGLDPPRGGDGLVIVDLCTGSGNLALALKAVLPGARVLATDLSEDALSLARENAARTGLEVDFRLGDLFSPLPGELRGRVDLLVANPPYVAEAELESLPAEVREHEPSEALVAGPSGDEVLARIAEEAFWWLAPGGWLFCEIAEARADRARALFSRRFTPEIREDLTGRPRILVARKGAPCAG